MHSVPIISSRSGATGCHEEEARGNRTDEEVGGETVGVPERQDVAREGLLPACLSKRGLEKGVCKAAPVVEERWFGGLKGTHFPGRIYIY